MKKEITLVITAGFFILAYALDYIAGPVSFNVRNPIVFLSAPYLSKVPLTAVAIGIRAIAILLTTILALAFIEGKHFTKALILFIVGGIAELYAIQQMATGNKVTTIQWTLSLAYAGMLLTAAIVFYILKGIVFGLKQGLSNNKDSKDNSQADTHHKNLEDNN